MNLLQDQPKSDTLLPLISGDECARDVGRDNNSLIDLLLTEQQNLTAVERFPRDHADAPPKAKSYSQLLPASGPGDGQQYAFEVDLDRCSGCKACVTACHSMNGLDAEETF